MGRRRKWALLSLLVVILLAFFCIKKYCVIKEIEVEGNKRATADEIKDYIFDKSYDVNTLVFWIKSKFEKKKSIPFVATYDIDMVSSTKVKITIYEKDIVGYMQYMGSYIYFDKDGIIVESSSELIEDVPLITGLNFDSFVLNEKLPVNNEDVFNMILDLTQNIRKYKLMVDKIYISEEFESTLYIGDVKVLLGSSDDINQKLSDLSDMSDKLEGKSGTLDMKEVDRDGQGYAMKVK